MYMLNVVSSCNHVACNQMHTSSNGFRAALADVNMCAVTVYMQEKVV